MLDFIVHQTQLSARENFIEIVSLGYLHLIWHRLGDFAKSKHKKNGKFSSANIGQEKYTKM